MILKLSELGWLIVAFGFIILAMLTGSVADGIIAAVAGIIALSARTVRAGLEKHE